MHAKYEINIEERESCLGSALILMIPLLVYGAFYIIWIYVVKNTAAIFENSNFKNQQPVSCWGDKYKNW